MSKLGDLTGSVKQDTVAIKKSINNVMGGNNYSKVEFLKVPLKEICLRYENYYIDNIKEFKAIRNDIEINGLQQPIVIVDIDKKLASYNDENRDEEYEYLLRHKELGCKYYVSSGHRRFKAYCALYLNKAYVIKDDIETLYRQNLDASKFNEKYSEITAKLLTNNDKEEAIYNGTNLTSRSITNFEYVVSCIANETYNLEDRGYLKKVHDDIYDTYGNSINISDISRYVRIFTSFPKEYLDCVFDGTLPLRTANKMLPILDRLKQDKDVINKIKAGTFKLDEYLPKRKRGKRITYSKKDVLEYLYTVKRNPEKIDEIIATLEK